MEEPQLRWIKISLLYHCTKSCGKGFARQNRFGVWAKGMISEMDMMVELYRFSLDPARLLC